MDVRLPPVDLDVRSARPADMEAVLALVEESFTDPDHDGREEVQIVLDTWRLNANLPELEIVATSDGTVVGHVLGARGSPGSPRVVGVAPLCVAPNRQGQGVGTALMTELLRRAERQHWPAAVVLGDPRYYGRFGFEPAGALGFVYEVVGAHDPHFMVKRLSSFDSSVRGTYRYCWESST